MTRRLVSTVAVVGFFGVAVVLLLSDRAPALFPAISSAIRTVGRRVEAITGIDVIDREQIPFDTDLLGHATLWFCGMVVIGFALRKKIPTVVVMLVLIAIGIGFEFAQLYWTQSRHISIDDAIANGVGVVAGTFVVVIVGGVLDLFGFVHRRFRRRTSWVGEDTLAAPQAERWGDMTQLDPTETHEAVSAHDPWIPPGSVTPTYIAPSAPTWRYGTAAAPEDDAVWAPPSSAAPRPRIEPTQEHRVP